MRQYLPDVDIVAMVGNDSVTRESDLVRLHILAQYGGFWMDASTVCYKPLDWIQERGNNSQYFGFYLDGWTSDVRYPVIENWFFACVPRSSFVQAWLAEFMRINEFTTVNDYVASVKQDTNVQGIPLDLQNYLAMHIAAQRVLQNQGPWTGLDVISATQEGTGPLYYLAKNGWDTEKAVDNLCDSLTQLIKFRGAERNAAVNRIDKLGCIF